MIGKWLKHSRSTGGPTMDRENDVLDFAAVTDPGMKRAENQDSVFAGVLPGGRLLLAVADGVGGAAEGAAASRAAVECLHSTVRESSDAERALLDGLALGEETVSRLGTAEERPATTLVAAVVEGSTVWLANVGDSRAYLVRASELSQLTEDHSWVAEQVRSGRLTAAEARSNELRNVITRAIGNGGQPDIFGPGTLASGDILILCSDGLHGVLDAKTVAAVTGGLGSSGDKAKRLVQLANEAGGPDNISVVLYHHG